MKEQVYRLYHKMSMILSINPLHSKLLKNYTKYRLTEFNILALIIDLTSSGVAHIMCTTADYLEQEAHQSVVFKYNDRHQYGILKRISNDKYQLFDAYNDSTFQINGNDILKYGDAWVLMFESTKLSHDRSQFPLLSSGMKLGIFASLFFSGLTIYFIWKGISSMSFYFLLAITGTVVAVLLTLKHYNFSSATSLNKLCSNENLKFNCDAVLNSRFAQLTKNISTAEVGLWYLTTTALYSIFAPDFMVSMTYTFKLMAFAALLGAVVLTFVQYYYLKEYCPLCLIVAVVISAQSGIILMANGVVAGVFDLYLVSSMFFSGMLIFIGSSVYMQYLMIEKLDMAYNTFANDHNIFRSKLERDINKNKDGLYVNYSPESDPITVVIVPACNTCKIYVKELLKLLMLTNSYSICLQIDDTGQFSNEMIRKTLIDIDDLANTLDDNFAYSLHFENDIINLNKIVDVTEVDAKMYKKWAFGGNLQYKEHPVMLLRDSRISSLYTPEKVKAQLVMAQYHPET